MALPSARSNSSTCWPFVCGIIDALHVANKLQTQSLTPCVLVQTAEFWHQLEALASEHQTRLFGKINRVLAQLSADIEDTVGGLLSLRLEPSHLRLDPPTPEALHESMAQLISKGARLPENCRTGL